MKKNIWGWIAISLLGSFCSIANAGLIGPTPYVGFTGSPFSAIGSPYYFHLENFESGSLATPGVHASSGFVLGPASKTDSVDGDDGAIDGFGTAGHSWYVQTPTLTFSFDANVLDGLPTYAGIVWTDVGYEPQGIGFDTVTFEAFDAAHNSLGVLSVDLGDGSVLGETAEDRFFGAFNAGGISSFSITTAGSDDWEVDHLQYGRTGTVPTPPSLYLLAAGLVLMGLSARRRRV